MQSRMKLCSLMAAIVVLNVPSPAVKGIELDDLTDMILWAQNFGKVVKSTVRQWMEDTDSNTTERSSNPGGLKIVLSPGSTSQVLSKLEMIYSKLNGLEVDVQNQAALLMHTFQTNLPKAVRNELRISKLMEILNEIDRKDNLLKVYKKLLGSRTETSRLWSFTSSIISHEYNSVLSLWDRLHSTFLVPEYNAPIVLPQTSILHQMADTVKEYGESLCHVQQSPMQMLHSLHNTLQLSQLKAYSLMQFAWHYRKSVNESHEYEEESKFITDLYLSRLSKQTEVARDALKNVSQALWRCDPSQHVLNNTFTQVTHFMQGFLVNEVDMDYDASCWDSCGDFTRDIERRCFKGKFCANQPVCKGVIRNCHNFEDDMWVCLSDYASTKRRYEWISFIDGPTFGQYTHCRNGLRKAESWRRWIFWKCSYCFCICDELGNTESDRYFSLSPTLSKMEENKVLTGLRLVKINKVFYIQGQEGQLMSGGEVNETTLRWIHPTEVSPNFQSPVSGSNYFKLTWDERSIALDDLVAPPDHVLTGIKWSRKGSLLYLQIQACRWDITTGELLRAPLNCSWYSYQQTTSQRKPLYFRSTTVPIKSIVPSKIDSTSLQYLDFIHTDKYEDAAQSVVPYIDTQPVVPSPVVALVGAGIYHKGVDRSGGFIAPKVFTMDFSQHAKTNFKFNE